VRPGGSWGDVHTLTKRNSCIIDRKAFLLSTDFLQKEMVILRKVLCPWKKQALFKAMAIRYP
jgi:hypothetical protein